MHSAARWSRRRANINILYRRRVVFPRRPKQNLTDIHRSARNISAYKIRVHALKVSGGKNASRQNAVAETGANRSI